LSDFASERQIGLLAACQQTALKEHLQTALWKRLDSFADWFGERQQQIEEKPVSTLRQILVDIDYDDWLRDQSSSLKAAEYRIENVKFLISNIEKMLQNDEDADFRSVIAKLVLFDLLEQQEQEDNSDRVQLSTLHASKGLEFPHVFLMGAEEGYLPHHNSIEQDGIEEERRLMYVGITRAQRSLHITYCKQRTQYGEKVEIKPSRFLDELPEICVQWKERHGVPEKSEEEKKQLGNAHLDAMRNMLNG
jgi:ATP-dependent DNA helicase Rep